MNVEGKNYSDIPVWRRYTLTIEDMNMRRNKQMLPIFASEKNPLKKKEKRKKEHGRAGLKAGCKITKENIQKPLLQL